MGKLILKLNNSLAIRKTVKFLRLHFLANWWLRRFPVKKRLPGSGVRYRVRRIESFGLAVEMFDNGTLYPASDLPANIRSFADLGCNVGYFTCWLRHQLNTPLAGLIVDANADALEDAQWHVNVNNLHNVHVLHGLIGEKGIEGKANFFLHVSNVCSTAVPPPDAITADATTWTQTRVPCVKIEENWIKFVGNMPCDLLKVDIEGSEMSFLQNEVRFLRRVQTILLEWHKWRVSLDKIESFLSAQNFSLKKILHEEEGIGTAVFVRKP